MERQLRWYEHLAINSYWLGLTIGSGVITPLLLPYLVVQFMPPEYKNTYLATLRVVGLAVAMLVQPVAGLLSDRSTSRFGRRRPFILAGGLLSTLFLVIIAVSPSFRGSSLDPFFQASLGVTTAYAVLLGGLILLQVSANIGQGALQGLMPDIVPANQRGRSSGVKSVFELLPSLLIVGLSIGRLIDRGEVALVVGIIMAAYLITMIPTLIWAHERPLTETVQGGLREPILRMLALTVIFVAVTRVAIWLVGWSGTLLSGQNVSLGLKILLVGLAGLLAMAGSILVGVYFGALVGIGKDARQHMPFIWWVINRLLFLAAVGSIQGFAQYFLADVLHLPNAVQVTTVLLAVVALFLIPSALFGGVLADRLGHRRLAFYAGLVAALGTVVLLFAVNIPLVIVAGSIIGLATGTFMATNWALGTNLIPPQDAGRYLGISNLAGAGAGIVGAGIGGPLADFFNHLQPGLGYLVLFAIYAGLFVLSSVTLGKVKG